ncbi:UDP-N-acetylglucosamine diphosphorylase [Ascoidea rubescens DSM 1968]|uniref:UDP-N-acetylglucosamine diphosphorylase n=1 Tax=Ascoidea rubescens DSM 1968 TaxID=1344418 RepID=A0A1D2VBS3_9ASCO|nr:UDP-N-acetylglucosamine pyrophosphorylase [Ascoidea rubescens DSM 1968]ODV59060.1 UDP-N-acetylglucosamine pyrophosphorylase [Ascoidea rubescens DSM 1968]
MTIATSDTETQATELKQVFAQAGQSHLFQFYNELSTEEREQLLHDASEISSPSKLINSVKDALELLNANSSSTDDSAFYQLPNDNFYSLLKDDDKNSLSDDEKTKYYNKGLELIKQNKVGIILMAGGQGTRLGSSSPKGTFRITIPSNNSLFELQAKRIKALQKISGGDTSVLPWYIMTSEPTRAPTENFFKENNYFGLNPQNVIFFNQGTLPCFNLKGDKILLSSKSSIAKSPDGNGGLYKAIYDNNLLDDFKKRNLKHIHMYCVDNCLVKVADPLFIGLAVEKKWDLATKVVRKTDPNESVGLIISKNHKPAVIEYSEISSQLANKKDPANDSLLYLRAANIVNHFYSVDLLSNMIPSWINSRKYLPYHIAKKKIPYFDTASNQLIKPTSSNGIKLEQFIFDIFESISLEKFGCLEVKREEEFSPLKNASGAKSDTPETSASHLLALHTKWLKENGAIIKDGAKIELDGLISYSGEGLQFVKGKLFNNGDYIK